MEAVFDENLFYCLFTHNVFCDNYQIYMNEIKLVYTGDVFMGNFLIRYAHMGNNGGPCSSNAYK